MYYHTIYYPMMSYSLLPLGDYSSFCLDYISFCLLVLLLITSYHTLSSPSEESGPPDTHEYISDSEETHIERNYYYY